jgi:hypothetical protein
MSRPMFNPHSQEYRAKVIINCFIYIGKHTSIIHIKTSSILTEKTRCTEANGPNHFRALPHNLHIFYKVFTLDDGKPKFRNENNICHT